MLKYLCLAVLFFLNLGCTLPGPFDDVKAYYTQSLTPLTWSENGESLYLSYLNRTGKNLDFNFFYLKVDLSSHKVDYLYKQEKEIPGILGQGLVEGSFLFSANSSTSLFQMKQGKVEKLLKESQLNIRGAPYTFIREGFLIASFSVPDQNEKDAEVLNPKWGRYALDNDSILFFRFSPGFVTPLRYLNPFGKKVYLSSFRPGDGAYREIKEQHAWGDIDVTNAEISQVKIIPEYEGYYLRFWDWLSEDEILFERQSQTDRLRNEKLSAVSYRLSTQSYEVREDFRQKGLLSPTKDKVAFVKGDFLMISQPDGSHAEKILFIPRDLPKGDPEYLE